MRAIATLALVACTTTPTAAAESAPMTTTASAVAPAAPPLRNPVREALASRFGQDPEAASVALGSFDALGTISDVLAAQRFDGGYRGTIDLVPALPIGADRKHLAWVTGALKDFDGFFAAIAKSGSPRYRWRDLTVRFFRSVGNTTPNAFAAGWTISYNVHGSIDTSSDATRETVFHEIFHLNDADHGDWSPGHVTGIQDAIERRCGVRTACLAPYAPTSTLVRRGTYYAFQPGNDAHEYAAEVALRWYREHPLCQRV